MYVYIIYSLLQLIIRVDACLSRACLLPPFVFVCFFPFPVLFHYCFLFIYCWIICLRCRCLPVAYLIHINIFTFMYSLLHCRHLFTCMPACRLPLLFLFFSVSLFVYYYYYFLLLHYSFCGLSCTLKLLYFLVFPIFSVWEGGGRGLARGGQGEL